VRMQYYGQLNDIDSSPAPAAAGRLARGRADRELRGRIRRVYASSARSPEFGYLVTHVIVHGTWTWRAAPSDLPEEPARPSRSRCAPSTGEGERRQVRRQPHLPARDGDGGNTIEGPAIVEHSATTFAIRRVGPRAWTDITSSTSRARRYTLMATLRARERNGRPRRDRLGRAQARRDAVGLRALFAETGRYAGLHELQMMSSDPIGYEKLFSRIRGGLVSRARRR